MLLCNYKGIDCQNMAADIGLLVQRYYDGELYVRVTREDDVNYVMNQLLTEFAFTAGFIGVTDDKPGPVCTAELFKHGMTHVIWMVWVPGFDQINFDDKLKEEDGYVHLAKGRPVTAITQEDFYR